MKVLSITFFIQFIFFNLAAQVFVNVKDFGATGNSKNNDWMSIQKAIDYTIMKGGGTVYFPKGTYLIDNNTILVWGSNINLKGENKNNTKLLREGLPRWWGELLCICGKLPGGKYFGGMGELPYSRFSMYKGSAIPSENINISDLTFDSGVKYPLESNNIGISNSRNVLIYNCIIKNAPKSNVAIVNDTKVAENRNITLRNCAFENSGQNNVRVISYNQGSFVANSVVIDSCSFKNVRFPDRNKELMKQRVLLWYRAGIGGRNVSLKVQHCNFDASGIIAGSVNVENLSILNSTIPDKIQLSVGARYRNANALIKGNYFKSSPNSSIILKNINLDVNNNTFFQKK